MCTAAVTYIHVPLNRCKRDWSFACDLSESLYVQHFACLLPMQFYIKEIILFIKASKHSFNILEVKWNKTKSVHCRVLALGTVRFVRNRGCGDTTFLI